MCEEKRKGNFKTHNLGYHMKKGTEKGYRFKYCTHTISDKVHPVGHIKT